MAKIVSLKQHYNQILDHNREIILSGGTGDEHLYHAATDNRMSLVLLLRISPEISERIEAVIRELKELEPDLYYYPKSDFHITVIDILKGEANRQLPENLEQYRRCIEACIKQIKPFQITFDGLTASDGAVMVCGYYEEELQKLRASLRENFRRNGLELQERYETKSCHITIARTIEHFTDPKALLAYIEKEHFFGTMQVEAIEFSFHNWYDTKKEILNQLPLR